jgi:hypothetical protein
MPRRAFCPGEKLVIKIPAFALGLKAQRQMVVGLPRQLFEPPGGVAV